ncbi:hypothetical protein GOBAR_AA32836 [Gossypium barbadense]|uniref:Uncharacterized protein n=1 Tax=Gossypium barbadense TaxID=3634 RepID=A0A2P5W9R9_GOSBA|nr:hypothetical protein GOBAR_AA32836 [Gossypium barbadense]
MIILELGGFLGMYIRVPAEKNGNSITYKQVLSAEPTGKATTGTKMMRSRQKLPIFIYNTSKPPTNSAQNYNFDHPLAIKREEYQGLKFDSMRCQTLSNVGRVVHNLNSNNGVMDLGKHYKDLELPHNIHKMVVVDLDTSFKNQQLMTCVIRTEIT